MILISGERRPPLQLWDPRRRLHKQLLQLQLEQRLSQELRHRSISWRPNWTGNG